jgi:hypothetical protein
MLVLEGRDSASADTLRYEFSVYEVTFIGASTTPPRQVFRSEPIGVKQLFVDTHPLSERLRLKREFNDKGEAVFVETDIVDVPVMPDDTADTYVENGEEKTITFGDAEAPEDFYIRSHTFGKNTLTQAELDAVPPYVVFAGGAYKVTVPRMSTVTELTFEFNANYEAENFDSKLQPERALVGAFFIQASDANLHKVEKLSDADVHLNRERTEIFDQRKKIREAKRAELLEQRRRGLQEGLQELKDKRRSGDEDTGDVEEQDEDADVDDKATTKRRLVRRGQVEETSEDEDNN